MGPLLFKYARRHVVLLPLRVLTRVCTPSTSPDARRALGEAIFGLVSNPTGGMFCMVGMGRNKALRLLICVRSTLPSPSYPRTRFPCGCPALSPVRELGIKTWLGRTESWGGCLNRLIRPISMILCDASGSCVTRQQFPYHTGILNSRRFLSLSISCCRSLDVVCLGSQPWVLLRAFLTRHGPR